ncbi:MAG TPA: tetratricopeptide repeat protein [Phycisphaerales bacterium]|nr:tetratricopeptide repeat protein [Phycisphaerales bacterium]
MAKRVGKKISKAQQAEDQRLGAFAQKLQAEGRVIEAAQILEQLVKRHPDEPSLLFNLGMCRMNLLQHGEARKLMAKACRHPNTPAESLAVLAVCHMAVQDLDSAGRTLERALEKDPNSINALRIKAEWLNISGRAEEGVELLRPLIEKDLTDGSTVAVFAKCCRACKLREEALDVLRRAEQTEMTSTHGRASVLYELAAELEHAKEYDDAFAAATEANSLRPTQHTIEGWESWVDQCIEAFSEDRMKTLPRSRRDGTGKVFIVGMPRSGTTLVEQIIASHPRVVGIGERQIISTAARDLTYPTKPGQTHAQRLDTFSPAGIDRIARRVLHELDEAGEHSPVIVDKLMQNFLHAGVIELLLPGAKIIHCLRDPRDVCLSCYMMHFPGPENQAYSRRLDTLAHYYRQHLRLMDHWHRVLTTPIHTIRYEELVADKEGQARGLIEFLGLEWDDACLESHRTSRTVVTLSVDQVRKPMYTSSMGRWKNFQQHLGPVLDLVPPDDG